MLYARGDAPTQALDYSDLELGEVVTEIRELASGCLTTPEQKDLWASLAEFRSAVFPSIDSLLHFVPNLEQPKDLNDFLTELDRILSEHHRMNAALALELELEEGDQDPSFLVRLPVQVWELLAANYLLEVDFRALQCVSHQLRNRFLSVTFSSVWLQVVDRFRVSLAFVRQVTLSDNGLPINHCDDELAMLLKCLLSLCSLVDTQSRMTHC